MSESELRARAAARLLENLPPSLRDHRETLAKCLEAMDAALPLPPVLLFGSHCRGEARADSDVDLCLVTGAVPLVVELTEAYFADRYPGFDLDDPDWLALAKQIDVVAQLLAVVRGRVTSPDRSPGSDASSP